MSILGLSFPAKTQALTQYAHIAATGAACLQGKVLIAMADGVHALDSAESDNGSKIRAWFKSVRTDFGTHSRKRFRSLYIRGLLQKLEIKLISEGATTTVTYNSSDDTLRQEEGYVQGERSNAAPYWQIQVGNVDGEDFSVDSVDVLLAVLSSKRGRRPEQF